MVTFFTTFESIFDRKITTDLQFFRLQTKFAVFSSSNEICFFKIYVREQNTSTVCFYVNIKCFLSISLYFMCCVILQFTNFA